MAVVMMTPPGSLWSTSCSAPQQAVGAMVVVVVLVSVTLVVVVVVLVLADAGQLGPLPGEGHASQQLVQNPTIPCFARQCAASFLILHFVPFGVVIQHVTAPAGLPQIEWDAHFLTALAQLLLTRTEFACCAAQLT